MENNACLHDDRDGGWMVLHCGKQNLEAVCQNAKGISNNPPSSGQSVIEDPLFICKTTQGVWIHCVLPNASLERGSGARKPMGPSSAISLRTDL